MFSSLFKNTGLAFSSIIDWVGLILFPFRPKLLPELEPKLQYIVTFLLNVAFAGLLCLLAMHITSDWTHSALSILTAIALFALGSLGGFILALPRVSGETSAQPTDAGAGSNSSTKKLASPIGFNNNLVDISDWITKSILTLSIANWEKLQPGLLGAAAYLALDNSKAAHTEAMGIIIGYTSIGLLYAYITTRTLITSLLSESINQLSPKVANAVDDAGRVAVKALDSNQSGDEPRRQNNSISTAEKNTASAIASLTAGVSIATIKAQLERLAKDYSNLRANQKSGPERTSAMEEIAGKMRAFSEVAAPLLSELKTSDQAGLRLAAISILEIKPDAAAGEWLAERLSTESPFMGYHAALALAESAAMIPCSDRGAFLSVLNKAKGAVPPASDRANVIVDAASKLAQRCPDVQPAG